VDSEVADVVALEVGVAVGVVALEVGVAVGVVALEVDAVATEEEEEVVDLGEVEAGEEDQTDSGEEGDKRVEGRLNQE
jgi:hypothetical protein